MNTHVKYYTTKELFIDDIDNIIRPGVVAYDDNDVRWVSYLDEDIPLEDLYAYHKTKKVKVIDATKPSTPKSSLVKGDYDGSQTTILTCTSSKATIYYNMTEDGSEPASPTTSSKSCTSGYELKLNQDNDSETKTYRIKAASYLGGEWSESILDVTYNINRKLSDPTYTIDGSSESITRTVTFNCTSSDAKIYYSLNGGSYVEGTSIVLDDSVEIGMLKFYADLDGWVKSDTKSNTERIPVNEQPVTTSKMYYLLKDDQEEPVVPESLDEFTSLTNTSFPVTISDLTSHGETETSVFYFAYDSTIHSEPSDIKITDANGTTYKATSMEASSKIGFDFEYTTKEIDGVNYNIFMLITPAQHDNTSYTFSL